ncbi:lysoplasmalogenase [Salipaludibacillus aurantiacus]|uniref:Uncharacterized membrane protein YhhN n=1 Tax=Salipaludibacillus aurantiacus TaxID=1601833 RepID=A0A1H9TQJ3_9BACI|nr:lysoplasmalogenase [Salipaludibacillus aurantiacus]SER99311.1 Uncharacterized membrane protein YhhN [Salipaludibacillus aurantiacus]
MRQLKSAYVLPILILVTGLFYTFYVPGESLAVIILFKLIPMWLIIAYAIRRLPDRNRFSRFSTLMLTGLFFCMLGDAFIEGTFIAGLAAFLIGHLFYLAGFFTKMTVTPLKLASLLPIILYSFIIGRELTGALKTGGEEPLIIPVILYIAVISVMLFSSVLTGNIWAVSGSILFVISDSILAWNMFISEVAHSGALIMITYYSAQFLIAHSIRPLAEK